MSISLVMCAVDFSSTSMSPEDVAIAERIAELKFELGDDLLILGHHYQRDSIVMHADFLGDSFMLSQKARIGCKIHRVLRCSFHGRISRHSDL